MSEQSKWTVGSAIGLGVLLLALFANFNARFDDMAARFDDFSVRLDDFSARLDDMQAQIADLRAEFGDDIRGIRGIRDDIRRLDDRLRAVEIAFGKVDQRLLTLERILLPAPDAGAPDE